MANSTDAGDRVRARLELISRLDPTLNSFITVTSDAAIKTADALARDERDLGPLAGMIIAHKDIFCTRDVLTTCGSRMLANFVAPYDATVVSRCRTAGLISLGKTNMDEFAMGSSTETSFYGPTRNPWNPELSPGGSSGGSAVAVAAGLVTAATASDTGGSIRQPAALCGVTGFKPTYGRVSRHGMVAYASSLDQGGVISTNVRDAALLIDCFAGPDKLDSTCDPAPRQSLITQLDAGIQDLTIGIPQGLLRDLRQDCAESFAAALRGLESLGAKLRDVELPNLAYGVPTYQVLACAEASANLARYDGIRYGHSCQNPKSLIDLVERSRTEGFGAEVKRRILLGTYTLAMGYYEAFYQEAQRVRRLIRDDFAKVFLSTDVIATPTTPTPAFAIGAMVRDPVAMYNQNFYTVWANLAGLPALSIPAPQVQALPYGLQFQAPRNQDARLARLGHAAQIAFDWHLAHPDLDLVHAWQPPSITSGESS